MSGAPTRNIKSIGCNWEMATQQLLADSVMVSTPDFDSGSLGSTPDWPAKQMESKVVRCYTSLLRSGTLMGL